MEQEQPLQTQSLMKDSVLKTVLRVLGRIILFVFLVLLFFVIGLIIGYAVIGKGNFWEVLSQDTWRHILQLVTK